MTSNEAPFRLRRHPVFDTENFLFIYFNSNIHEDNEFISRWCDTFSYPMQRFDKLDPCIDFLTDLTDQVSLILCVVPCEGLVPLIHEIPHLIRIYIARETNAEPEDWMKTWKKVQIISNDPALMFNQLYRHIRQATERSVPISVARSSSTTNLNDFDPSFMYSQLLKEAILQLKYNEEAKKQFVGFCRENSSTLMVSAAKISEFERCYTSSSAIWWYTKEPFIYSTLNQALRLQDIDVILNMDFYIQDLHRELEKLQSNVAQNTIMTLYRGQGISSAELERIKNGEGSFLSFNSFLSTSSDREVSHTFADSARSNPYLVGVLFVIEIDPSISSVPFASLSSFSDYPEQEILFSMNTIFRVGKVEIIDDRLWQVNLTLTNDTDPQLTELTEHIRKINEVSGAIGQLGTLLMLMGKYDQAEAYYMILLERRVFDNDYEALTAMYNQLGYLYMLKENLPRATFYWNLCLDTASHNLASNHPAFPAIHNNLAVLFKRKNQLDRALQSLQDALDICLLASQGNELNIAAVYKNIGDVWTLKREYGKTLENYNFSLAWFDKGVPQLHPERAKLYEAIAYVHSQTGDKLTALSYYQKSLGIYTKSLPSSHPSIALNLDNIACVLECLGRFKEAAEYAQRATEISHCAFSPDHLNVQD